MDREGAQDWLDRYVAAWLSYEPDEVSALFSEDVCYRYSPHNDPIVGRQAVVVSWLGVDESEDAAKRDAPGTYDNCLVMRFDGAGRCRDLTEYYVRRP